MQEGFLDLILVPGFAWNGKYRGRLRFRIIYRWFRSRRILTLTRIDE